MARNRNPDPFLRVSFTLPLSLHRRLTARVEDSPEYSGVSDYIRTLLERDLDGGAASPDK